MYTLVQTARMAYHVAQTELTCCHAKADPEPRHERDAMPHRSLAYPLVPSLSLSLPLSLSLFPSLTIHTLTHSVLTGGLQMSYTDAQSLSLLSHSPSLFQSEVSRRKSSKS